MQNQQQPHQQPPPPQYPHQQYGHPQYPPPPQKKSWGMIILLIILIPLVILGSIFGYKQITKDNNVQAGQQPYVDPTAGNANNAPINSQNNYPPPTGTPSTPSTVAPSTTSTSQAVNYPIAGTWYNNDDGVKRIWIFNQPQMNNNSIEGNAQYSQNGYSKYNGSYVDVNNRAFRLNDAKYGSWEEQYVYNGSAQTLTITNQAGEVQTYYRSLQSAKNNAKSSHNSAPAAPTASGNNTLNAGNTLFNGMQLTSRNGQYTLKMQSDGHLCIYKGSTFVWGTGVHGFQGGRLVMQADGNLVVYQSNVAKWESKTHPAYNAKFNDPNNKPVKLILTDDGNLVLYSASGQVVWRAR